MNKITNKVSDLSSQIVYADDFNSLIDDVNPSTGVLSANTISEYTSGSGVTVDGVLLKDSAVRAGLGSAAAPSLAFATVTNMGWYATSIVELGSSVEGTLVGRISKLKGLEYANASISYLAQASVVVNNNTDPATKSTFASDLVLGKIFTGTPAAPINYTLPTGTEMDTANAASFGSNFGIDVSFINLSANAITLVAAGAFTIVGNVVIAANTSTKCRVVRTGANTYVLYRLS